ncbi:MAG TPA: nuclear transport factor 2 family protein [Acidimicrobiales bacterium]|jgi:3-phenylpropionate/cinnamic acid dioxygenase small subunit
MGTDRDEIANLLYTYAERIDAGDFDGMAELFADAEMTFGEADQVRRGSDEVRAAFESSTRRYDDGTPKSKHVMTNVIVTVDETAGTATARSYFTVLQAVPDHLALQPVAAGRYHDTFARSDGAWRFRDRQIFVDLVGDLSHHLLYEVPDLS